MTSNGGIGSFKRYAQDVLDVFVTERDAELLQDEGADGVLAFPGTRHALLFRRVWRAVYGVSPSALDHCEYCEHAGRANTQSGGLVAAARCPGAGALSADGLARFFQQARQVRIDGFPDVAQYAERLAAEPAFLRAEVLDKLRERYGVTDDDAGLRAADLDLPGGLRRAHAAIVCIGARPPTGPDHADLLHRNPCTARVLPDAVPETVRLMHAESCRREALKYAFSRDYMFVASSLRAKCAFVGEHEDAGLVLSAVADSSTASDSPPFVCHAEHVLPRGDAQRFDFYHHALYLADADEFDAMPRTFAAFVAADGPALRRLGRGGSLPAPPCRAAGGSLLLLRPEATEECSAEALGRGYHAVSPDAKTLGGGVFYAPRAADPVMGAFARFAWKGLLSHRHPAASQSKADGVLLHEQYMLRRCALDAAWRGYQLVTDSDRCVMIVENRDDPATALAALTAFCNLPPGWGMRVVCAPANRQFYADVFARMGGGEPRFVLTGRLHSKNFNIECYNAFMKREDTWTALHDTGCHTVLAVQSDGTLVRPGLEHHAAFDSDYAGAPWTPHPYLVEATRGNLVGNGGFSFRRVAECARVCREHDGAVLYSMAPGMTQAEDVFFAAHCARPCASADAVSFAMEQVPYAEALGYHRFWMYHPVDFVERHFAALAAEMGGEAPSAGRSSKR